MTMHRIVCMKELVKIHDSSYQLITAQLRFELDRFLTVPALFLSPRTRLHLNWSCGLDMDFHLLILGLVGHKDATKLN